MKSSYRRVPLTVAALFLASVLTYGRPPAPQKDGSPRQSPRTLKASTRLVIVDVVATDRRGAAVADLTADDLTILEDGVAQKVSGFSLQRPGDVAAPLSLPPNVFSNLPQVRATSLNVILLDGLNGEFASRAYAYDQLLKYLNEHPTIPPTAVYGLETKLKLLHGFTTDTNELMQAVRDFRQRAPRNVESVYATASPFTQKGDFQANEVNITNTLVALDLLAQSLSGYAGRKNLIWLSEAFPENLFPDFSPIPGNATLFLAHSRDATQAMNITELPLMQNSDQNRGINDYSVLLRKVSEELTSAQVAVYPIDPAGVGKISRMEGLRTMETMATATGGKIYANQNDLVTSIGGSLEDGSTYYTLTYYPDNKNWDGKFRQIAVKTSREGVTLRHRTGYYASDPSAEAPEAADIKKLSADFARALSWDAPNATAVLFRATVVPGATQKDKLLVNFAIDPRTLKFDETPDGVQHARVSCALLAYSAKGSMVREELNNMTAKVQPEQFPKLMNATFPCQITTQLNSGKYTLRLGVTDRAGRRVGTTTATVVIP